MLKKELEIFTFGDLLNHFPNRHIDKTQIGKIGEIRPEILVKGGDYDMATLPETALVQSWGGRALALPFVAGYSTTALVKKIRLT